jgi:exodeoxyribonuclease VII small subunit
MSKKNPDPDADPNAGGGAPDALKFEDAIERLEDIVRRMEEDHVPLDELLRDYEAGTRLLRVCRDRIEAARARIEQIGQASADGGVTLDDFEPGAEDSPGTVAGKSIRLL